MRIGIDARMYSSAFTGIGRYVYELVDQLIKTDDINEYVLFFNEPIYSSVKITKPNFSAVLANAPLYSLAEQTSFAKKLYDARLDLMHFTHFNAPIFYRGRSIVTIHDLTLSFYPGKKMTSFFRRLGYHAVLRSVVRRSSRVITVSEHTKNDLSRVLAVPKGRIAVVHLGVSPDFHPIQDHRKVARFKKEYGIEDPFLLYTGNWRDHKNLVNLIKAFSLIKNAWQKPLKLVITGREDPWYPEVKQAVKDEELIGDVRFTGLVSDEDLVLLYNAAELYVFPSYYEGFGLPALEAFACGTPVCASRSSCLPEICDRAAVYFNPDDPTDIAKSVLDLLNDPKKRSEYVELGFKRLKNFSWEKMAKKTREIYNETVCPSLPSTS